MSWKPFLNVRDGLVFSLLLRHKFRMFTVKQIANLNLHFDECFVHQVLLEQVVFELPTAHEEAFKDEIESLLTFKFVGIV